VALSYCWGSDPDVFTLTSTNLPDFRSGIPERRLATAIKEAIQICQALGIDYLQNACESNQPHPGFQVLGVTMRLLDGRNLFDQVNSAMLKMEAVLVPLAIPLHNSDDAGIYLKGRYDFFECTVNGLQPTEKEEEGQVNIDPPRASTGWITKGYQEGVIHLTLAILCESSFSAGLHGLLLAPMSGCDGPEPGGQTEA